MLGQKVTPKDRPLPHHKNQEWGHLLASNCLPHLLDATEEISEFLASSPAGSVLWVSVPVGTSRCPIEKEKGGSLGSTLGWSRVEIVREFMRPHCSVSELHANNSYGYGWPPCCFFKGFVGGWCVSVRFF